MFAGYKRPLASGDVAFTTSYYRTSKIDLDPAAAYVQNGYGVLNAKGTYTFPGGRYSASLYADNITDAKYLTHILPVGGLAILQNWAWPFTYGVEFAAKY